MLSEVLLKWRNEAALLREYGQEQLARACERHADEVECALRCADDERLSLSAAARETGLSVDHLARLVRHGRISNAGRKGAPRIRRGDLPRKPRRLLASDGSRSYDPVTDARSLVSRR